MGADSRGDDDVVCIVEGGRAAVYLPYTVYCIFIYTSQGGPGLTAKGIYLTKSQDHRVSAGVSV